MYGCIYLSLVRKIWREETVPQKLGEGMFVMLYKEKGKVNDRSKYRCICLLNHAYKLLSAALLRRLVLDCDGWLPESQAGFMKARGCPDNIVALALRQHSPGHLPRAHRLAPQGAGGCSGGRAGGRARSPLLGSRLAPARRPRGALAARGNSDPGDLEATLVIRRFVIGRRLHCTAGSATSLARGVAATLAGGVALSLSPP